MFFEILPGESDWWQIDCNPIILSEIPVVTLVSWTIKSFGNVVVDTSISGPHASKVNNGILYFWASALNSIAGDESYIEVTLVTSSGESILTNPIYFYTVLKRTNNCHFGD